MMVTQYPIFRISNRNGDERIIIVDQPSQDLAVCLKRAVSACSIDPMHVELIGHGQVAGHLVAAAMDVAAERQEVA